MGCEKRTSLGVMVGGVHSSFPRNLLRGIYREAQAEQINVFYFLRIHTRPFFRSLMGEIGSNQYDYQFNTIFDYCRLAGLDGIVLGYGTIAQHLYHNNSDAFIHRYNRIPLVVVPAKTDMDNCYSIISDNRQGMKEMARHLINEHACRKILFMRGPRNNTDAEERLQGYLEAMQEAGLEVLPSMVGDGDFSDYVDDEVRRLLSDHPDADAIMFSNDEMAKSGYRVCIASGIRIGTDLKITGYDCGDFSEKMTPPLSTVLQDAYGMGIRCISDMMQILNGNTLTESRYPTKAVLRESCGCISGNHADTSKNIDYESELKRFRNEAATREREYQEFQGKSWFIPMIARDLNDCVEDDREFCRLIMEKLKALKTRAAYLFLQDSPVSFNGVSDWSCPDSMRLASRFRNGVVESYPLYDRPLVTAENGFAQITDDGEYHQFMVYLLFSGETQYGLLMCDVPLEEISFFYVVSLQIGLSMRYFEISKRDALRRREMTHDIEVMRQKNRELGVISSYDEMTHLLNQRGLREEISKLCENGPVKDAYVVYCDMDHLKEINDTWGHHEGNCAIRASADILKSCIRSSDILARSGGDEFVCLVSHADLRFPDQFTQRLQSACDQWNRNSGKPYRVEISSGVVGLNLSHYADFQRASAEADHLMYTNKKARKKERSLNSSQNSISQST